MPAAIISGGSRHCRARRLCFFGECRADNCAAAGQRHLADRWSQLCRIPAEVQVYLSRELLLTSLSADDLLINGQPAAGVRIVNGAWLAFDTAALDEGVGNYTLSLAPNSLTAVTGNRSQVSSSSSPCRRDCM